MREKALLFGEKKSLVGVVTEPPDSKTNDLPAIILLNAGMLHRVGPNRFYVKMARKMAEMGFVVLRFDLSGIGDSGVRGDNLPFEKSALIETRQAMDYLSSTRNMNRFVLMGLCSGADLALNAASEDERVSGIVMVNGSLIPQHERGGLNQYFKSSIQERYYRGHIFSYKSWWRLLSGKSDYQSIKKLLRRKAKGLLSRGKQAPPKKDLTAHWRFIAERDTDLFLIFSEGSASLDAFNLTYKDRLGTLKDSEKISVEVVQYTDHVFTLLWSQRVLLDLIGQWAQNGSRNWFNKNQQ